MVLSCRPRVLQPGIAAHTRSPHGARAALRPSGRQGFPKGPLKSAAAPSVLKFRATHSHLFLTAPSFLRSVGQGQASIWCQIPASPHLSPRLALLAVRLVTSLLCGPSGKEALSGPVPPVDLEYLNPTPTHPSALYPNLGGEMSRFVVKYDWAGSQGKSTLAWSTG